MDEKNRTICVLPWGNPTNWKEVEYLFDDKSRKSKTTMFMLHESLKEKPYKPIYLILVNDTLIEDEKEGGITDYKDIENTVKSKIESLINSWNNEYNSVNNIQESHSPEFEVLVLPGIGKFGDWQFIGNPKNWISLVMIKVLDLIQKRGIIIKEIVLDTSHGVNYTTVFSEQFSNFLAEIGIIQNFGEESTIPVSVYNSEPYHQEATNLEIHSIRSFNYQDVSFSYETETNKGLISMSRYIENSQKEEIGQKLSTYRKKINKLQHYSKLLIRSYEYPLPLLLKIAILKFNQFETNLGYTSLEYLVQLMKKFYENYTKIDSSNQTLTKVTQLLELNPQIMELLLKCFFIKERLEVNFDLILENYCLNIDKMKKISDIIYSEPLNILSKNEISQLEKNLKEVDEDITFPVRFRQLKDVLSPQTDTNKENYEDFDPDEYNPNKRNFIAHAGLEADSILIDKDDEGYNICYDPDLLDKIINSILN